MVTPPGGQGGGPLLPVVPRQLFPVPLVAFASRPSNARSGALRQRWRRNVRVWSCVNRVVCALNSLYNPVFDPSIARRFKWGAAAASVRDIWNRVIASPLFSLLLPPPSLEGDRAALSALAGGWEAGYECGGGSACVVSNSEFLTDKVSLPAAAVGDTSFLTLLPESVAQCYAPAAATSTLEDGLLNPPWVRDARLQQVRRFQGLPPAEYRALVVRLWRLNMVAFLPHVHEVNGLFGVWKIKDGCAPQIRLIFDGRRANCHHAVPPPVRLPHPSRFGEVVLQPGEVLWVGKLDLKDYYHHLKVPDWIAEYFGLPPLRLADLPLEPQEREVLSATLPHVVFPTMLSLPMGWAHSVYIAQGVHETLLSSVLPRDELLSDVKSLAASRNGHAAYVDDLNVWRIGQQGDDSAPAAVDAALDAAARRAAAVGLPENVGKRAPAALRQKVLGVLVDGERGVLQPDPDALALLVRATRCVVSRGWASRALMERLVGKWTWAMLTRRPALSIFGRVYQYMCRRTRRPHRLWPSVARELQLAVDLAPFLFADLRAPVSDVVVAIDASMGGQGVVYKSGATDTMRQSFLRGDRPPQPGDQPRLSHLSDERWFSRDWRVAVMGTWRHDVSHINVAEVRAYLSALKWLGKRQASRDARHLLYQDSGVVVCAAMKGRSSSPQLARILRQCAAVQFACGLWPSSSWVPTDHNPADGPSRGRAVWAKA